MAKSKKKAKKAKKAHAKELTTVAALEQLFGKGTAKRVRLLAERTGAEKAPKKKKKKS